jgi:nitroreductase
MKTQIKKIIKFFQLKTIKPIIDPSYYNEIEFFQNIRAKKYVDKMYKESLLRSTFHQLDKRLIGTDISPEMIKRYEEKLSVYNDDKDIDSEFLQWAKDLIAHARQNKNGNPYQTKNHEIYTSSEELFDLIVKRRSIRSFEKKGISNEIMDKILTAGLYAPTGCNRQNINYLLLESSEDKKFCQKLAGEPGKFVIEAPVAVVILVDCRTYENLGHRHQVYLETGAAVQNMILYALSLNIGSIWLNWATTKIQKLKTFYSRFNIPEYCLPTAMVVFGYIDKKPPLVPVRKSVQSSVFKKE